MSGKIKGFDSLRGASVLLVTTSHAVLRPAIGITNSKITDVFSASAGVNIFLYYPAS